MWDFVKHDFLGGTGGPVGRAFSLDNGRGNADVDLAF